MLAVTLIICQSLLAQTKTVTGKVTDSKDGSPIAGATISLGGRSIGVTNLSGEFSVSVPTNTKKLSFTSIGFNDIDVNIGDGPVNVSMVVGESKSISEVVVTGYTTIQRKKFSGASANISPAEVRKQPFGSFDQALQGQAAGVSAVANSGQPGSNAIVRIRGNGSISGGNVPLYIVDGIEVTAADFSAMNQGDFERVEVLKDGVATAMYGSRGANGVIVITTRRGRAGQINLSYDTQFGFSDLPE
jgi:TonB-dependent SusC/RagA subfamily outer membrane receptor